MGKSKTRRDFLKTSVVAAGVLATRLKAKPAAPAIKVINPNIDNLRVVCCHDPEMVTGTPKRWDTIADQNEMVNVEKVQDNMDRMAMVLADKTTPKEAWGAIFQLPASKKPEDVKVAFKVNCKTRSGTPKNNPRIAILDKLCKALNSLGIPYPNIILFDGDDEEASALYAKYLGNGLPEGVIVSKRNAAMGGTMKAPVPMPWGKDVPCTKDLANGKIDILLNVTVNKGSHSWTGPATISLKNHFGTFKPSHDNGFDLIVGVNKSDAIVGGNPVRQQLCFVDSIWACVTGPSDPPNKEPHRLIMGTSSPIVDYLVIKKIREPLMEAKHKASIVQRYATDFGYEEKDITDFIDVDPNMDLSPVSSPFKQTGHGAGHKKLKLNLTGAFSNTPGLTFKIKKDAGPVFVNIHSLNGRRIRSLDVPKAVSGALKAAWDGRGASGSPVKSGTYVASVIHNGRVTSKKIRLVK